MGKIDILPNVVYLTMQEFDKHVRSFVYMLDGSAATTKIQLPKDPRQTRELVFIHLHTEDTLAIYTRLWSSPFMVDLHLTNMLIQNMLQLSIIKRIRIFTKLCML